LVVRRLTDAKVGFSINIFYLKMELHANKNSSLRNARIAQLVVRRLTDAKVGFSINIFLFENGVTR